MRYNLLCQGHAIVQNTDSNLPFFLLNHFLREKIPDLFDVVYRPH